MSYRYSIPKRKLGPVVYSKDALYREYAQIMLKLLLISKKPIMDAEDIVHDLFVKILARWENTDWVNLEAYLSWMLNNCVVNFYRNYGQDDNKTSGSELIELIDAGFVQDPLRHAINRDINNTLKEAITLLSPAEQVVFHGFYLEGKSVNDLKGERKTGTVLALLHRARTKVIDHFRVKFGEV